MNTHFLSCDWGTSSFRLRLVAAGSLEVLAAISEPEGISVVYRQWQQNPQADRLAFYGNVLAKAVATLSSRCQTDLSLLPLVLSGMASASIGMLELPYTPLPFAIDGSDMQVEIMPAAGTCTNPVLLVSGVCTHNDVMRGEETLLAGALSICPVESGWIVFPGTHCKHVWVAGDKATRLHTFMTGELFQLLATQSILANSVAAGAPLDETAFDAGVVAGSSQPLLQAAFSVRTNQLFTRYTPTANYWYLSGLVIGSELQSLLADKQQTLTIVASEAAAATYQRACAALKLPVPQFVDESAALVRAHALLLSRRY